MKLIPNRAPLNIVPFIDIMLVLLCMVLSVSTFIAQGEIKIDIPEVKNQQDSEPRDNSMVIEISAENHFYLDHKELSQENLITTLQKIGRDIHLELRVDEKADFGLFVKIIDELRDIRHDNFSIATKKK